MLKLVLLILASHIFDSHILNGPHLRQQIVSFLDEITIGCDEESRGETQLFPRSGGPGLLRSIV